MRILRRLEAERRRQQRLVHLIALGDCPAIPAAELAPGMVRLYNYGYTAEIVRVEHAPGWVHVTVRENGKLYRRRHRPTTLIPVVMRNGRPLRKE